MSEDEDARGWSPVFINSQAAFVFAVLHSLNDRGCPHPLALLS